MPALPGAHGGQDGVDLGRAGDGEGADHADPAHGAAGDGASVGDDGLVFDAGVAADSSAGLNQGIRADVDTGRGGRGCAAAAVGVAHGAGGAGVKLAVLKALGPGVGQLNHVGVAPDAFIGLLCNDALELGGGGGDDHEQGLAGVDFEGDLGVQAFLQGAVAGAGELRVGGHQAPAEVGVGASLVDAAELNGDGAGPWGGVQAHDVVAKALGGAKEGRDEAAVAGPVAVQGFQGHQAAQAGGVVGQGDVAVGLAECLRGGFVVPDDVVRRPVAHEVVELGQAPALGLLEIGEGVVAGGGPDFVDGFGAVFVLEVLHELPVAVAVTAGAQVNVGHVGHHL